MTISEAFDVKTKPKPLPTPEPRAEARRAHVRAIINEAPAADKIPSRVREIRSRVAADWTGAWIWDAEGPTIRNLWDGRAPSLDDTAAGNKAMRALWTTYNHTALAVLVPLLFVAWLISHPARLLYTIPFGIFFITLWLI